MPTGSLLLNGERYTIRHDTRLPSGRRAWQRVFRATLPTDPGVQKAADWQLWGPVSRFSREQSDGFLGPDYYENLDGRFQRLTSTGKYQSIDCSTDDPISAATAPLGGFALGAAALGGGASGALAGDCEDIHEDRGYIFVRRGPFVTQIDPSDWSVVQTVVMDAVTRGAAVWRSFGYVGLGPTQKIQKRTGVNANGATYADVALSTAYGKALRVGDNRLFFVSADEGNDDEDKVSYTFDDFDSRAAPFIVGDQGVALTGIGILGANSFFGSERGVYSFTDGGDPVSIISALRDYSSQEHGHRMDDLHGWLYVATDLGLFAVGSGGEPVNPVGIGSRLMQGFEGFTAVPREVRAIGKTLYVSWVTPAGVSHLWGGLFGDLTASTGELDWFPVRTLTGTMHAIGATSLSDELTLLYGDDDDLERMLKDPAGQDHLNTSYPYSAGGGTWYGMTMRRDQHRLKNPRYFNLQGSNLDANNTYQLAIDVDESGSYTNVGSAQQSNGFLTIRPVSGGAPLTTLAGHTYKPRLVQAADDESNPPTLDGNLRMVYDERPDHIWDISLPIALGDQRGGGPRAIQHDIETFEALIERGTPIQWTDPDDPTTTKYGMVAALTQLQDADGNYVEDAILRLQEWETA